MDYDTAHKAIQDAEETFRRADQMANHLAYLLKGRLRKVDSGSLLVELKKELRKFNIQTRQWNP